VKYEPITNPNRVIPLSDNLNYQPVNKANNNVSNTNHSAAGPSNNIQPYNINISKDDGS